MSLAKLASRVAAQLSREAPDMHIERVARDALIIAVAAMALQSSNQPMRRVAAVQRVAQHYGATAVHADDPHGMTLGLRFTSGLYTNAGGNVLYLV
jgi:hypothetical protein